MKKLMVAIYLNIFIPNAYSSKNSLLRSFEYKNLYEKESFSLKEISEDNWEITWNSTGKVGVYTTKKNPEIYFSKLFRDFQRSMSGWGKSKCKEKVLAEMIWREVGSKKVTLCRGYYPDHIALMSLRSKFKEVKGE